MFAVRDQENLVHGQQQAAASKPLNQGTRGLQPKTPGNKYPKTPLRIPLNDENAPGGFGKSIKGKGIENLQTGGKKGATFDKNAFITPMGRRLRNYRKDHILILDRSSNASTPWDENYKCEDEGFPNTSRPSAREGPRKNATKANNRATTQESNPCRLGQTKDSRG